MTAPEVFSSISLYLSELGFARITQVDVQVKKIDTTGTRPRTIQIVPKLQAHQFALRSPMRGWSMRNENDSRSVGASALGNGGISPVLVIALELEVSRMKTGSRLVPLSGESAGVL